MDLSEPTKTCPRCSAVQPTSAAFCGACGWSFSAPAGPAPVPVTALGQQAPGSGPHNPPVALALAPMQSISPGAAGFPPGAGMPGPRQSLSRALLAVIVLAGVLTVAIPGFFVFGGHGSSLLTDRHGLPGDVPLPNGVTFQFMDQDGTSSTTGDWYWTVASPNTSDALRSFYQSNLSSNGWTVSKTLGSNGDYEFLACQGNQSLDVEMVDAYPVDVLAPQGNQPKEISPPAGGSVLRISLSSGC